MSPTAFVLLCGGCREQLMPGEADRHICAGSLRRTQGPLAETARAAGGVPISASSIPGLSQAQLVEKLEAGDVLCQIVEAMAEKLGAPPNEPARDWCRRWRQGVLG